MLCSIPLHLISNSVDLGRSCKRRARPSGGGDEDARREDKLDLKREEEEEDSPGKDNSLG